MKNYVNTRIIRLEVTAGELPVMFLTTDPIEAHYNLHFEEYGADLSNAPTKKCNACECQFVTLKHFDKCPICGYDKMEK